MKPENSDLIQKKGRMDPRAFDDLYNKYRVSVYSLACYLTQNQREAEDLFQETWLRVVQNLHKTSNMRDLKAWIFTITANLYRDELRKKRIRRLFFLQKSITSDHRVERSNSKLGSGKLNTTSETNRVDMCMAISQAMADLPDRQRLIFVLKEIEGFKHSEISEILGLPVGTIKSQMHRAVKRLQRNLWAYNPK